MGVAQARPAVSASEQCSNQALSEPVAVITKQTCNEYVEVVKGKDGDRPAWHIVLVSCEKQSVFKQKKRSSLIQIDEFGRNIKYRDRAGIIRQASGYGTEPPEQLLKWIHENYDPCAIDEKTSLIHIIDDIRLCTIQRTKPEQSLGIVLHYHRHERFHYITLNDDYESTLAFRAGLKPFDRIIEYNGSNIEHESAENLKKRIDEIGDQLFQLLVCNPATHAYYKKHNRPIHSSLRTIKRVNLSQDRTSTNDHYHVLQKDDTVQQAILVNSAYMANNKISNTRQEFDDSEFVTAHEELIEETIENRLVQSDKKLHRSQILPKQTPIYDKAKVDQKKREHEKQKLVRQLAGLLMDNQNNMENNSEIHRVQCYGCGSPRIYEDRYKCLECYNYDLCGRCFDQRRETLNHINGHVMVHFSDYNEIFGESVVDVNISVTLSKLKEKYAAEEHTDIACNNCKMLPVKGLCFKCDTCPDFDLCVTCMEKRIHDRSHPLLAIGKSRFSEISIDDIELNDELGRGGFGTVYKAKWISKNRQMACKVISVTPEHAHLEKSFRKELTAYAELSGPYILKTYGYNIQQLSTGIRKCMLVMEYMPRCSLTNVLRQKEKIPIRRKLEMACQIASGMRKIHAHRMIHRDIRPDNVLVTQDYTAKIGDMGLARVWIPNDNLTLIGCVAYMPFEFYTGEYDQSLDVYTFGLTINQLFTEKKHDFDLLTRRITLTTHSPVFSELIARCIHNDPKQRPSAIEIEITLRLYKQACEKYILENNIKYGSMSTDDKNVTFITIYDILHPEISKILKSRFPQVHPVEQFGAATSYEEAEFLRLWELLQQLTNP